MGHTPSKKKLKKWQEKERERKQREAELEQLWREAAADGVQLDHRPRHLRCNYFQDFLSAMEQEDEPWPMVEDCEHFT